MNTKTNTKKKDQAAADGRRCRTQSKASVTMGPLAFDLAQTKARVSAFIARHDGLFRRLA